MAEGAAGETTQAGWAAVILAAVRIQAVGWAAVVRTRAAGWAADWAAAETAQAVVTAQAGWAAAEVVGSWEGWVMERVAGVVAGR